MPRSSRHKSSKHSHSSRDYSETEKEVGVKEKKGREDGGGSSSSSRHLKDLASGEKRKLDSKSIDISKDAVSIGNAEYNDEFVGGLVSSSSKKRKEKIDDDRWTGEDNEHELSKTEMKEKEREVRGSGDSKRSSRRETSYVSGFDVEEGKKSGSKGEGKHHRSERKERGEKDGGLDRERKGSRSDKSEKLVDIVSVSENTGSEGNRKQCGLGEERSGKHGVGNTDFIQEEFKNAEPEKDLDRRVRRKRDTSGDEDRHHDAVRDPDDRRQSSREEIVKSGKYKDDGQKDERSRDRFQEDLDKELWRQDEKQRDNRGSRDYTSGKSDDKHLRNDKKDLDVSHKKSKSHGGEPDRELDRERERDRDRGRDHDRDRGRDHDRARGRDRDRDGSRVDHDRDREHDDREHDFDRERDRDRDLERVHDRDRDRDIERVHDRDRELDRDRDRGRDRYRRDIRDRVGVRDHDRGRDRDFDHDHDYASHNGEKGSRYKDDRGRRRSPDGYDDYHGDKLRRVENEMDKERSLSRKPNVDSVTSSSRHKASPSSRAYVGAEKYRDAIQDETKYGDSLRESTLPEALEKAPKYRSGEKRAKFDDNHGEFAERSPKTKVSPAGLKERSPSSTSFDRSRFSSRNARRRSLDVDDAERRSSGSNDVRDNMGMTEDRQGRDLPSKKSLGDEYPPTESPYYHKSGQGSASSHGPGPSVFRNRAESPSFAGSFGEDNRGPGRYRRSVDPNVARGPGLGPGNAWKGIPNWPSPITNGFMPFPPPGPHIGGFPPMLSQFPPLFGVRPALDINHQGMPYQMADGDRFPGHLRPIGWPNMVEGPMPPHFHQWDGGNGILRDDSSMYGPGHLAQRRDMNSDIWKQNGDVNMDVTSGSQKDGPIVKASTDEASSAHGGSKPNVENSCLDDQATSFKKDASSGLSAMKEMPLTPAKGTTDKTPESTGVDDTAQLLRAYLAKLDISMDLADPELYNQCISLGIKGDSEFVEDEVEPEFMEEKTVVGPEIMNFTMDVKIFPAAKESIFQRAMNLYKTQSCERNNGVPADDDKICCPSPCQPEVELNLILEEKIDCPADFSVEQEEQTLVLAKDIVPTTGEGEREELNDVSITGDEAHSAAPLQSSDLTLDVGDDTQLPVLDAEKMEEEPSFELIPENADKGHLSVESTYPDSIVSTADENAVDGGKIISSELALGEQLDAPVSGPLNLSTDSVKVCEALISVSNESESVVLSRIHHAPESTH